MSNNFHHGDVSPERVEPGVVCFLSTRKKAVMGFNFSSGGSNGEDKGSRPPRENFRAVEADSSERKPGSNPGHSTTLSRTGWTGPACRGRAEW